VLSNSLSAIANSTGTVLADIGSYVQNVVSSLAAIFG
jgi:hypothetical protein